MNLTTKIAEFSQGNPGAMNFLLGMVKYGAQNPEKQIKVTKSFKAIEDSLIILRGWRLYVLFNDICERDYDDVLKLLLTCPRDLLEDACNRQDRSGKEMVKKYLEHE
ncbi:hypothetical protein [uncultured Chryseobacterium sp.]|uniref:hypothetical protein n=1 Tax=uncultured Chryseobacterium sp. TaxID=259322 RepID=UPI0025FC6A21|nr:hypothetical protein [uncultured Chryseobacterium sp.]